MYYSTQRPRWAYYCSIILLIITLAPINANATSTLTWVDMADNEDGFTIQRRRGGGDFVDIGIAPTNTQTFIDTDGFFGDCYQVDAYNGAGHSGWSNIACKPILCEPCTLNLTQP